MKRSAGAAEARMIEKKKGPKAAIADVNPITPPAWRRWKIAGICLNVEAFPIPAKKKIASIPHRNLGKSPADSGLSWTAVYRQATDTPRQETSVTRAPPTRSEMGPARIRAAEPTRAPRKAY